MLLYLNFLGWPNLGLSSCAQTLPAQLNHLHPGCIRKRTVLQQQTSRNHSSQWLFIKCAASVLSFAGLSEFSLSMQSALQCSKNFVKYQVGRAISLTWSGAALERHEAARNRKNC